MNREELVRMRYLVKEECKSRWFANRMTEVLDMVLGNGIYRVWSEFTFDAAHDLEGYVPHGHKCENLHGHTYHVRVEFRGALDENGMVIDYAKIKEVFDVAVMPKLDHSNVNDTITPSTSENIARWIWEQFAASLAHPSLVEVRETATSGASYGPPT